MTRQRPNQAEPPERGGAHPPKQSPGSAPQLDERRWTIYRDRIGDRIGHWQVENTPGVADAFGREKVEVVPLAASSGAGELDLTDEECAALLAPATYRTNGPITLESARSKLRARLDRKDNDQ